METQPIHDCIIPDEDSKFTLLPDRREVAFSDSGGLRDYLQNEIAAWTNIDITIVNKYQLVLSKVEAVRKDAKEGHLETGALSEVKTLLSSWAVNGNGINSCVDSHSLLGEYIM